VALALWRQNNLVHKLFEQQITQYVLLGRLTNRCKYTSNEFKRIIFTKMNFTDQLVREDSYGGKALVLERVPQRVISIVPSQSEFVWDLGLRQELVGITKFCIHPDEMFRSVERVGGTKSLDIEKIRKLKPDLIIGNKEENERGQIELLQKEFNVWISDIYNFDDALAMMRLLGSLLGKEKKSHEIAAKIAASVNNIKNMFNGQSVAYFIWYKPYMLAAKNTFIDHVLNHLGFINTASELNRYPELDVEAIRKLSPDFCFLSSEPYPFKEKHIRELQEILPSSKIILVDGEMFSWYGSRLLKLEGYIKEFKNHLC
jgi:ABC-type Fe3+-hydroxamate transport system substrate-binding protein